MTKITRLSYSENIPSDWVFKGQLSRTVAKRGLPETFDFYLLPDGTVAEVISHPMNDVRFVDIRTAEEQRSRWAELIEGEKWEQTAYYGYGRYDFKKGRYPKAVRTK